MNNNACVKCGKSEIEFRKFNDFETTIRGVPFTVPEATIGFCKSCGAKVFEPSEIRRWQRLYESDLLLKGKLLSAVEICKIREALGLQINEFALLLGTTRQSVYNWERQNRKSPQLRLADLLLRLVRESLEWGPIDVVEFLRRQAERDNVLQSDHPHNRGRRPRRRSGVLSRQYEPLRYEQAFEPGEVDEELPSLQMC